MRDIRAIRRNEQRKALANQLYNLGAALAAASGVRVVQELAVSWIILLWILSACALILTAHSLLALLEEDADDL